jgi:hypothetical protein
VMMVRSEPTDCGLTAARADERRGSAKDRMLTMVMLKALRELCKTLYTPVTVYVSMARYWVAAWCPW